VQEVVAICSLIRR